MDVIATEDTELFKRQMDAHEGRQSDQIMEKVEQWYTDSIQKALSNYNDATNDTMSTIEATQFAVLKQKMKSMFEDAATVYQPKMQSIIDNTAIAYQQKLRTMLNDTTTN